MTHTRDLSVVSPGRIHYAEGLKLQEDLVKKRRAGEIDDTLVVLEHPHVITLGSSSDIAHILVDDEERARLDERLPIHEPALERKPCPPQNLQMCPLSENHSVRAAHG